MKTLTACTVLTLATLAAASPSVAAQATVPAWRDVVVYAADAAYPVALARRGVQGEAVVELTVDAEARERTATVRTSSRSAELDALAMTMARRMDIAAADGASGLVRVRFLKDHSSTVATKTCADFNVDAAYQVATFPERRLREMPAMVEGIGMLIHNLHSGGSARSFPAVEALLDATVAACARTPASGMLDVMRQEALKLIEG
jgi:TonB family protein